MDLSGGLLQFILRNCMRQPTVKYVIFCHPYADSGDITIQEMFGKEKTEGEKGANKLPLASMIYKLFFNRLLRCLSLEFPYAFKLLFRQTISIDVNN